MVGEKDGTLIPRSISTTGNVASEVEVEKDGTLITRSISTTGNVASEAVCEKDGTLIPSFISMAMNNRLNLILNLFPFRLLLIFGLTWLTSYRIFNGAKENKSGLSTHQPHIHLQQLLSPQTSKERGALLIADAQTCRFRSIHAPNTTYPTVERFSASALISGEFTPQALLQDLPKSTACMTI